MTALLEALTRPELDTLMHELEHAERVAHTVFVNLPLGYPARIASACGLAGEMLNLLDDVYSESIRRMIAGEIPA